MLQLSKPFVRALMLMDSLAYGLGRRFPRMRPLARHASRAIRRLLPKPGYWQRRKNFNYYREVIRLARKHAPSGEQVIDVGASETAVLQQLDWFKRRVALDRDYVPAQPGIETVKGDFLEYQTHTYFDLVLCLQVLEHAKEPALFAQKLMKSGKTVIVSVPYKWPKGRHKGHIQDPVDEMKLELWTQRQPIEMMVVKDRLERLIAVYQRENENSR